MSALLAIDGLHAFYGQSHVLQGVTLELAAGEIVSVLGRNGAGRSTLLKAIVGQTRAEGSILFGGRQLLGLKSFEIARCGIAYVPESRDVFPTLTVQQNLLLGVQRAGRGMAAPSGAPSWSLDDMYSVFPQLALRRDAAAGVLSGGEQQMLSLCRSLMGNPRLMLIDEPTEGLAPQLVDLLAQFLVALQRRGIAILLIEQKLSIALDISQRVCVLGHGKVVYCGSAQDLRRDRSLCREWLDP
jgi:branched-chain amino acid transport system ATP-binding protein